MGCRWYQSNVGVKMFSKRLKWLFDIIGRRHEHTHIHTYIHTNFYSAKTVRTNLRRHRESFLLSLDFFHLCSKIFLPCYVGGSPPWTRHCGRCSDCSIQSRWVAYCQTLQTDWCSYDTIRDAILTCARKPAWVSLIYRTEPTTKKCKNRKKLKVENRYAQK